MIVFRKIYIQNGDTVEPYKIYSCNCCNEDIEEAWPMHINEEETEVFCLDCALKLNLISGRTWCKLMYGDTFFKDATWHDGYIHVKKTDDLWPWEKGQREQRRTALYRNWRKKVFDRDNYICQRCGNTETIEAHHIKPFATNPKTAFDVDNGITLCKDCHKYVHSTKDKEYLK